MTDRSRRARRPARGIHGFRLRFGRDTVLFLAGLAGVFHETVLTHSDRPNLIVLFGAMIGLPAFLRTDEFKRAAPRRQPVEDEREDDWMRNYRSGNQ